MRSLSGLLVVGISAAAAALAQPAAAQDAIPAQVTEATSGSTATVRLSTGLALGVRLIGVDAPRTGECGGDSARVRLEQLAVGRSVLLVRDPQSPGVDGDGRSLYYLDRDDGLDVGLELLRGGWAEYSEVAEPFARQTPYFDADGEASGEGNGLWTSCGGEFHRGHADEDRERKADAVAFVRRYYRLISQHRYRTAWPLLPGSVRRKLGGSFRVWRAGHRGSIGATVRSARVRMSHGRAVVTVSLGGGQRDVCSGRVVRMSFRGRWVLASRGGEWVAVTQHIHKAGGGRVRLTKAECAPPKPTPPPRTTPAPAPPPPTNCQGYSPCLPPGPDVDCAGGSGDGPRYTGPVSVNGSDPYGLDSDGDGVGCET